MANQNPSNKEMTCSHFRIKILETIILPAVLYGSETLGQVRRLRAFENRILRRVFRPKTDENNERR